MTHTVLVILGGAVLLAVFVLFGKLWGDTTASMALAAKVFIPFWLVVSVVNLWIGVSKAGYTVREEAPILLLVFAVPAIVAAIVIWRLTRT
jgi:hypothetical protein